MTEFLHLFTPVSEGFPEIKEGEHLQLLFVFRYGSGSMETKHAVLTKRDGVYKIVDFLFSPSQTWQFYTHYLDYSKLTTKERAEDFARQCMNSGFKQAEKYKEEGYPDYTVEDALYAANKFVDDKKTLL